MTQRHKHTTKRRIPKKNKQQNHIGNSYNNLTTTFSRLCVVYEQTNGVLFERFSSGRRDDDGAQQAGRKKTKQNKTTPKSRTQQTNTQPAKCQKQASSLLGSKDAPNSARAQL